MVLRDKHLVPVTARAICNCFIIELHRANVYTVVVPVSDTFPLRKLSTILNIMADE